MRLRVVGAVVAVLAATAGCTTVPATSQPEVVQTLPAQIEQPQPIISPPPGADPRTIVKDFLEANALNDPHHNEARAFLTTEARSRWSDATVTVVNDPMTISNVDSHHRITVSGREAGTIDASGVYTPSLPGDGGSYGGVAVSPTFGLKRVQGQWRISALQNGLLIDEGLFDTQVFQQRVVYFFDAAGDRLVPDPRWTQLTNPAEESSWLMSLLAAGPRGELQTMLPSQSDPKHISVTLRADGLAVVQVPGAGQLSRGSRDRLAAQVGATLSQVSQISHFEIEDGTQPVQIPAAASPTFTAADVVAPYEVPPSIGGLYYVRRGGVYDESGRPLPGKVGSGGYGLTSVALAPRPQSATLSVAGTRGPAGKQTLLIGTDRALRPTSLKGQLSRPSWDPTHQEVWIGDGSKLFRVTRAGRVIPVQVTAASGSATGQVIAVRLSPEGSRVALVLKNSESRSQLWIGSIVRTATTVRVDGLEPISPQGVAVTDVAWNDALKLFTIGHDVRLAYYSVYEVQVDGARWTDRQPSGLPQAPDSITVSQGEFAAVSAGDTVWKQSAGLWVSLLGDQTIGTNPVYVE